MQLTKTLSVLALATGAVVAMPANVEKRQWSGINRWWSRPSDGARVTVTGYAPEPTNWNDDSSSAAATSTSSTTTTTVAQVTATATQGGNFYSAPAESWSEAAPSPTAAWSEPAAPSATSAPATGGSGGQDDYMSVVSKWRAAGGLSDLVQDSSLEANALKTSTDSTNGLEHELNPGTFAQVLAPGNDGNFESVYVGGWLCEVPSLPGLDGICGTESQGWDHSNGETGHADILTSGSYSKIGCALSESTGVWACDLA